MGSTAAGYHRPQTLNPAATKIFTQGKPKVLWMEVNYQAACVVSLWYSRSFKSVQDKPPVRVPRFRCLVSDVREPGHADE